MRRLLAAVALLAALSTPAGAEPGEGGATVPIPAQTVCTYQARDGELVTWLVREPRMCATRPLIAAAVAAHEAKAACEDELGRALADNHRLLAADRPSRVVTALKWAGIGGAIVAAFVAGAALF